MTYAILSGAAFALAAVAALLFFRAYRRTEDRLFLLFGIAFGVLGAEQLLLGYVETPDANHPLEYVPRILAFGIILFAIVDRNRR